MLNKLNSELECLQQIKQETMKATKNVPDKNLR